MAIDYIPKRTPSNKDDSCYRQTNPKTQRPKKPAIKTHAFQIDSHKAAANPPNLIHRVLSKMTYGPNSHDVAHINQLPGADDQARVMAYIDEQLNPQSIDDSSCEQRLTPSNGFTTLQKSRQQLYQQHSRRPDGADIEWSYFTRPSKEISYSTIIRGIHSKRQLLEMMTDFWHNHFNVYNNAYGVQPMLVHYDRDVIRPNVLGNFRDMLYQVTRSTCMLIYLNNGSNEQSAPNENFAREVMELHTLGAENYLGRMDWQDVPIDNNGFRTGYVEADVMEMARALTGWSFSGASWWDYQNGNIATGLFQYRDEWHDKGTKRVLGEMFDYNQSNPQSDLNQILDLLASHPGTHRFLAKKLCRRFIADEPSATIIDAVADTLKQNWQAPDQIKLAMETLLKSNEFLSIWGEKIKRPFERTIGAMRQLQYQFSFNPDVEYSGWHYWELFDTGHHPFHWAAPNGYPDVKSHWLGTSSLVGTWKFIQWITHFTRDGNNQTLLLNKLLEDTLNGLPNSNDHTAEKIVDFWCEKIIGLIPDATTRNHLADLMASVDHRDPIGGNHQALIDLNDNSWPEYNQDRLYAMVATLFFTPEFIYR